MLFSEIYPEVNGKRTAWFDTILEEDTKLFIDPFLIIKNEQGVFKGSHEDMVKYFEKVYEQAFKANLKVGGREYNNLIRMLSFPEVEELCLGYSSDKTSGSGTGEKFAHVMAAAIFNAINHRLSAPTHFEEVALLQRGIAQDRISDITANILKKRFIKYTENICIKYGLSCKQVLIEHSYFDPNYFLWQDQYANLPSNPCNGKAVLLVPKKYLRRSPTINRDGFKEYLLNEQADFLRRKFNIELASQLDTDKLLEIAGQYTEAVREYVQWRNKGPLSDSYDLSKDPKGLYKWAPITKAFCNHNKLSLSASNNGEFIAGIEKIINEFQTLCEGDVPPWANWKKTDVSPASEEVARRLLLGLVRNYCHQNKIRLINDKNLGKKTTGFVFSKSFKSKGFIRIKRANQSIFWENAGDEIEGVLKKNKPSVFHYLVLVLTGEDFKKAEIVRNKIKEIETRLNINIGITIINAIPEE